MSRKKTSVFVTALAFICLCGSIFTPYAFSFATAKVEASVAQAAKSDQAGDYAEVLWYPGDKASSIRNAWGYNPESGIWYYFGSDGMPLKNQWLHLKNRYGNKHWYYVGESGQMYTGWLREDVSVGLAHEKYRFSSTGEMLTGWQQVGEEWYYFSEDGLIYGGWLQWKGAWYYLRPGHYNLSMGYERIDGRWSFFDNDGKWVGYAKNSGWKQDQKGWKYYSLSGWAKDCWKYIEKTWYRFDADGYMLSGQWFKSGNDWYYFYENGFMAGGWVQTGGNWYYLKENGKMAVNEKIPWAPGQDAIVDSSGKWIGYE